MRFMRSPFAGVLAATSLCASFTVLAQTVATATVVVGPTAPVVAQPAAAPKDLSTDLAKASLAKQGITNPTKAQLDAERKSIDAQRAQGKGWGVIAQSLGLNLGQVVSAANRDRRDTRKEDRGDKDRKEAGHTGQHGKRDGDRGPKDGENKSGTERSSGAGNAGNSGGHGGAGGNGGGGGGGGKGGK